MDESIGTVDVEVDFSKKALEVFFGFENRKNAKIALAKNNYKKLEPFLKDEFIVYNSLLYTIHFSQNKIAKKIINAFYKNKKYDVNRNHSEIFKFAVYYKNAYLVRLLVNCGSDIHVDKDYAFIQFCLLGNTDMVQFLIENGADVYARDSLALIQASGSNNIDLVNFLLKHIEIKPSEKLIEYQATNYDLALISATICKQNNIALLLLLKGANPTINNSEVLVIASESGNIDLVHSFLSKGADPNISGGLPLEKAVRNGHIDVVKEFVNFQIDGEYVCDLSIDNSAALIWACYKGFEEIAKLLIESKTSDGKPRCDINAHNNDAYRLARLRNNTSIIKLLEEHGGNN
ncbi:putative ankyrin repeat protein L25 [Tupanvirus soda lake]|uniref:Ankyrin repeat protein L25 n=2 Tax=Tupanvirus TaxID=2094720 RepID=A0AC62AAP2_9VIRU|nr:putative ankyrin repeat protein L25 [Tupanvirus soda lake]QKU34703.1 putative ankyrin repeat protein L25 [Tupanvirus soda lake]